MKFPNPYWDTQTKLELLEKWVLIHSIIYYELDTNIVSDSMFDNNSQQLVRGIKKFPQTFKRTKFYKIFKNFDGSTGFDLYQKLPNEQKRIYLSEAEYVINLARNYKI